LNDETRRRRSKCLKETAGLRDERRVLAVHRPFRMKLPRLRDEAEGERRGGSEWTDEFLAESKGSAKERGGEVSVPLVDSFSVIFLQY
jgi:hypothetical protein